MSEKKQKYIPTKEMIIYLISTFLFTNMSGMVGNYRQSYLVNVLLLDSKVVSIINPICTIGGFLISFFCTMVIDRAPKPGKKKFIPLVQKAAIPCGILLMLMFVAPSQAPTAVLAIYLVVITLLYNTMMAFGGCINSLAVVMSPDSKERDDILSFRGISNAIGNSAPLVVILVLGILIKDNDGLLYAVGAAICAAAGSVMLLAGSKISQERITYSSQKQNPILGYRDIIKNKYARIVLTSEFLKSFRGVATYMGIFLAAALLGDTSKYILFGLPTGVGTFVGMLIVKALLKKFNSKQIYIGSGVYSLIANTGAFAVGVQAFNNPDSTAWQIIFFVFLFLIGLQFGASNLLPSMFQADILEDLEVKTHKRLDASLPFVISIGSTISGAIATAVAPRILYGEGSLIHYIQPINDVYQVQTTQTKIMMLGCYTILHGVMMLLAGIPFFFYKLTGDTKAEVHAKALEYRASMEQSGEVNG